MEPVRFGCLGAARIVPNALVKPAKESAEADLNKIKLARDGVLTQQAGQTPK